MKLITFQSISALKSLINKGYLECDEKYINLKKASPTYEWILELKAYVRPDKFKTHRTDKEFLEICEKIKRSFDRCITKDSDILQGCIWRINIEDIESIEFLNDKNYRYGSLNYVRRNGKTMNWREDFYKKLK